MKKEPESSFNYEFIGRSTLGSQLTEIRKSLDMTRDEVLEKSKTGFSKSSLQAWENGEREPKLENLYELARIYGVHPWTLVSGEELAESDSPAPTEPANDEEYDYIPFYDIQASAGQGLFTDGATAPTKHLAFRKRWVQAKGLQADKLIALLTKGDSMEPTIKNGAVIIIDTRQIQPTDGNLYVIRIDEELYIKRVQLIPQGIRLISDNKAIYAPLDIKWADYTDDQLQVCGQLIHTSYDI